MIYHVLVLLAAILLFGVLAFRQMSALLLATLVTVFVSVLSDKVNLEFDMTSAKVSSLTKENVEFLEKIDEFDAVKVKGFMTMAPKDATDDQIRQIFRKLYKIYVDI